MQSSGNKNFNEQENIMKKFLALLLVTAAMTANAAERITILWGFTPASNTASILRTVAKEANDSQNKYQFVFMDRQGAGGGIAANHVLSHPDDHVYAATSTFFIRPHFNKEGAYNADNFQLAGVITEHAPIALYCKKYKSVADIQQAADVTIADSGKGSMLNLINSVFTSQFSNTRMIHYGTNYLQTLVDIAGGHIDCAWTWLSDVDERALVGDGYVVGITGKSNVKTFRTLKSQNVNVVESLTSTTALYASTAMPEDKRSEIFQILSSAAHSTEVQKLAQKEHGSNSTVTLQNSQRWFDQQNSLWKNIVANFKN